MIDAKDKLDEVKERLEQLERFEDALHEALHHVQEAQGDCPEEILFSHHAEMELDENLCDAQNLKERLERQIEAIE